MKKRLAFALAAALVIPLGLASRAAPLPWFLAQYAGDTLWALELYCVLRAVAPDLRAEYAALLCFGISVANELSQAIHTPFLDSIRATAIGHLLFGRGFVWADIPCYLVGSLLGLGLEKCATRLR